MATQHASAISAISGGARVEAETKPNIVRGGEPFGLQEEKKGQELPTQNGELVFGLAMVSPAFTTG
jgi:hypothetical protein